MNLGEIHLSKIGDADDIIYEAETIARETGLKPRSVFHLVSKGELPGAFKIGNKLALSRSAYRAGISERIAAASRKIAA